MLNALKQKMIDNITLLQTTLALNPVIDLGTPLTGTFFRIGDIARMPSGTDFPFWVAVVGGGRQDGRDQSWKLNASGPQFRGNVWHNIYMYIHPDTFANELGPKDENGEPTTDPLIQAEDRERFRARFQDWLVNGVFNTPSNHEITLASSQLRVPPGFDKLTRCFVSEVTKGWTTKSYGDSEDVMMIHFMHEGLLLGGY